MNLIVSITFLIDYYLFPRAGPIEETARPGRPRRTGVRPYSITHWAHHRLGSLGRPAHNVYRIDISLLPPLYRYCLSLDLSFDPQKVFPKQVPPKSFQHISCQNNCPEKGFQKGFKNISEIVCIKVCNKYFQTSFHKVAKQLTTKMFSALRAKVKDKLFKYSLKS